MTDFLMKNTRLAFGSQLTWLDRAVRFKFLNHENDNIINDIKHYGLKFKIVNFKYQNQDYPKHLHFTFSSLKLKITHFKHRRLQSFSAKNKKAFRVQTKNLRVKKHSSNCCNVTLPLPLLMSLFFLRICLFVLCLTWTVKRWWCIVIISINCLVLWEAATTIFWERKYKYLEGWEIKCWLFLTKHLICNKNKR